MDLVHKAVFDGDPGASKRRRRQRRWAATLAAIAIAAAGLVSTPAVASTSAPENVGGIAGAGFSSDGVAYDGSGQTVVVIDGAFHPEHPMLKDRVVEEACFGSYAVPSDFTDSLCSPDAVKQPGTNIVFESGAGSSTYNAACFEKVPEDNNVEHVCHESHGTKVAGLVAGTPWTIDLGGQEGVATLSGVAPGADLVLIKVGVQGAWNLDALGAALQYVQDDLRPKYKDKGKPIAAINISASFAWKDANKNLHEFVHDSDERPEPYFPVMADLKRDGVAVVVAAGNTEAADGVGLLAASEAAIAVGSTNVNDMSTLTVGENTGTNASTRVALLAPVGDGTVGNRLWTSHANFPRDAAPSSRAIWALGTSFAAPQVAGAFAVLRQRFGYENVSVDKLTKLLQETGVGVQDTREGRRGVVSQRMSLVDAANVRDESRSVWDFTGDGSADIPVIGKDRTTVSLHSVGDTGLIDPTNGVAIGKVGALAAAVYDYRVRGTNGLLASKGDDLYYYEYVREKEALDDGTLVAPGVANDISGIAYTRHQTKETVGTGTAIIIQKTNGQIVAHEKDPYTVALGAEREVMPAGTTVKLVGVADVSGDTIPDLVVRQPDSGAVQSYRGLEAGSTIAFASTPDNLATAAGVDDVFVLDDWVNHEARYGYRDASYLLNVSPVKNGKPSKAVSSGRWVAPIHVIPAPRNLKLDSGPNVWDATGDGFADVPVIDTEKKTLSYHSVTINGVIDTRPNLTIAEDWTSPIATPTYGLSDAFNGVLWIKGDNLVYSTYQSGSKTLAAPMSVLNGVGKDIASVAYTGNLPSGYAGGGFRGSGVVIQKNNGQISIHRQKANSIYLGTETVLVPAGTGVKLLGIADVNGDNVPDLIVGDATTKKPVAYLGVYNESVPEFAAEAVSMAPADRWGANWTKVKTFAIEGLVNNETRIGYHTTPWSTELWLASTVGDGSLGATKSSGTWPEAQRLGMVPRG